MQSTYIASGINSHEPPYPWRYNYFLLPPWWLNSLGRCLVIMVRLPSTGHRDNISCRINICLLTTVSMKGLPSSISQLPHNHNRYTSTTKHSASVLWRSNDVSSMSRKRPTWKYRGLHYSYKNRNVFDSIACGHALKITRRSDRNPLPAWFWGTNLPLWRLSFSVAIVSLCCRSLWHRRSKVRFGLCNLYKWL